MRRPIIVLDRLAGAVAAVVLIAAGGLGICWWYGVLPSAPERFTIAMPADRSHERWWPWATGVCGAVLVLAGLWWLVRHLPRRVGGRFALPGSARAGRLTADAHSAVGAAGQAMTRHPGVREASGRVVADRGQLVAQIECTIEPSADLLEVRDAAAATVAELHRVLGLRQVRHRVVLRVARADNTTASPRVI